MRKIAIYGKGGIGKSTIASNMAAIWGLEGLSVLLVGCDPKADSTIRLLGTRAPPILDSYSELIQSIDYPLNPNKLVEMIHTGYGGVRCVEVGGPKPGVGCAGRGITLALELLEQLDAFEVLDCLVFDVLGDVVCGGFATPMRSGYADEVYIVTSGEFSSIYAANNICRSLDAMNVKLGGLIANMRRSELEASSLQAYAQAIESRIIGWLPYSDLFQKADFERKTVIELFPDTKEADTLKILATEILENKGGHIPSGIETKALERLIVQFRSSLDIE